MRMTLELGGHAPVLVFDDCDPEALAKAAVAAKYRNAGQVCTSPTRFFVQQALYPRFVARFRELTAEIRVGNPFEADTQMGPLATDRRVDAVLDLVNDARACGAEVQGGAILSGPGNFLTPAVIARPPAGCLAAVEEPFGPIALISPFKSPEEAIEQANGLPQALAAYGFTQNARTIALLRTQLDAGSLAINHWQASWPETPFGGRGASGFGAEGGVEGLQAFQQIKFISQV
jgi:succinate-semialdehyde dehydrogenase/glutarate-semialdehyde dehydrogenase